MNTVEPIKDIEKLEKLKHLVLGINLKHFVYIKIGWTLACGFGHFENWSGMN